MLSATSLLLSLLLSPAALAFPNHDPQREIALTDMSGATTLGTWTPSESGVSLSTPHSHGRLHYWIPDDSNNHLSDGMVRARFQTGTKPDFTLLIRAWAPPGEPERLYAYGLSVEKGALALYQWTDGVVSAMGQRTPVDNWSAHTHIELVVTVLGPQIIAIAYDADTLTEIASLSVTDSALTSGRVGLRAHATQSSDTILTQLSLTAPRADIAQSSTPGLAQPGNERLVVVSNADASRIPTGMSFKSRFVRDNELWLVTNRIGVERIRRSGITPLSVSSDVPRFAIDPAYRKRMDQPMTPTKSGFRLDESYKDVEMVAELLQGWTERYPDIARVTPIGTSHQGRPILALRITDNPHIDEDEPAILLNAAHHGSELLATEYCLDAIATVLESDTPQTRRWIKELDLWFVPMVNPDGNWTHLRLNHNAGRKNGNDLNRDDTFRHWEGVDLNRNYPFQWGALEETGSRSLPSHHRYRGPSPASEPETRAMMALATSYHFTAAVSWHTYGTVILSPYTIDGIPNPEPDVAASVAEALLDKLPVQPSRRRFTVKRKMYSVDGTDQDWHFHTHGTLAYIVEGSHHNPKRTRVRDASILGIRPFFTGLLDRVLDGPRISGHITDDLGQPLEALITIDPMQTAADEKWTSRPRDGRYDRLVVEPGTYTVRATATGFQPIERRVTVRDNAVVVDLTLTAEERAASD